MLAGMAQAAEWPHVSFDATTSLGTLTVHQVDLDQVGSPDDVPDSHHGWTSAHGHVGYTTRTSARGMTVPRSQENVGWALEAGIS
mgnify:CR=1 FL=1